ncbi:hypothetical protein XELAEV_18022835mg [Xenopus laevis]|uniref:Uncharacterized protein n=1 Tax=Xenopus laevis TaxID=8355 RepID=A0A974HNR8_XENLA|nr:hypothetical protein XELAEV_18022835mg [Xenopus laevis]
MKLSSSPPAVHQFNGPTINVSHSLMEMREKKSWGGQRVLHTDRKLLRRHTEKWRQINPDGIDGREKARYISMARKG